MGDLKTSLWLKKNNINFEEVMKLSNELPDPRMIIIGEGLFSGIYIYSNKEQVCYRNSFSPETVLAVK
jgi:hypothetical protein